MSRNFSTEVSQEVALLLPKEVRCGGFPKVSFEPLSELLRSPVITPIIVPYIIPYSPPLTTAPLRFLDVGVQLFRAYASGFVGLVRLTEIIIPEP